MGSALSGLATIGMSQLEASADAQAATEDHQDEQRVLAFNAQRADQRGRFEGQKIRQQTSQVIGKQKVAYANSGVATDTGTPLSVMADTRLTGEVDAEQAENNAALEAWGYRLERKQSDKNLQRKYDAANRKAIGGALSGSGQIIGGAGGFGGEGGG